MFWPPQRIFFSFFEKKNGKKRKRKKSKHWTTWRFFLQKKAGLRKKERDFWVLIFVNFQHHRRVLVPDLQRKKTKQERVVACLLACPPQFSQKQDNLFAYLFTNWQLSFPTTLAPHPKKNKNKKSFLFVWQFIHNLGPLFIHSLGPKKKEKKKENLFVCLSIYPQLGANNNN